MNWIFHEIYTIIDDRITHKVRPYIFFKLLKKIILITAIIIFICLISLIKNYTRKTSSSRKKTIIFTVILARCCLKYKERKKIKTKREIDVKSILQTFQNHSLRYLC